MSLPSWISLTGKTALVAGASRGIGLAIAQAVARAGARTILAARSIEVLEQEASKLRDEGCQAEALELDMKLLPPPAKIPAADILVNVAGMNIRKRFESFSREEYHSIFQTNVHGIVELTQRVGAGMIERGTGGKVINIASLSSFLGLPYVGVYAMTKSAIAGLTRALAAEWGKHNIQVNAIAPGFILTDLNRDMWREPAMRDWLPGVQPNPRLGTPDDVAPLAVFLASAASDYITGQMIVVDGGFGVTAMWPYEPPPM